MRKNTNSVGSMKSDRDFDFSSTIQPQAGLLKISPITRNISDQRPIREEGKFEKKKWFDI